MSFAIARPKSRERAARLLTDGSYRLPVIKAGGMDVVDHLKEGLTDPDLLIDIQPLRPDDRRPVHQVETEAGPRISIDASATLAELAESDLIREHCPVIAQAAGDAATPQVRSVATAAGNLLQRPRCWYYRNEQFDCLKKGGSTCYAVEGENRYHAILGGGPCHIVHPSNLAPALIVSDAEVHWIDRNGEATRTLVSELFHGPRDDVESEHTLPRDAVITRIDAAPQSVSGFYAVKEKQSFDWPLVFACVALSLDGNRIDSATVCAGAVAPVPWPLPHVAETLRGVRVTDPAGLREACADAARDAEPMRDNAYKARLLPVAIRRAVRRAAARPVDDLFSQEEA